MEAASSQNSYFFLGAAFLGLWRVFRLVTFTLAPLGFTALALAGLLTAPGFTALGFIGLFEDFFVNTGFLAFFGALTTFLAAAPSGLLGLLRSACYLEQFATFVALGLASHGGYFLVELEEPEAPGALVCTRVPLLTRLLRPSLMRILFYIAWPAAASAFFSAAEDTPLRSLEEETACTISSRKLKGPLFFLGGRCSLRRLLRLLTS